LAHHCLSVIRRVHYRLSFVIVAVLALGPIMSVPVTVGAAAPVTAQAAIARNETIVGRTDAQTRITLAVALAPLVNQRGMEDFLAGLSDPQSPSYQKYLTPKEFALKFFDPAGRAQVTDFLKRNGLAVKDTGLGSIINATGTAAQVAQAFSVTLNDYRDANGKTFHANDKTPALPTTLAPRITAVLGLDTAPKAHSHIANRHQVYRVGKRSRRTVPAPVQVRRTSSTPAVATRRTSLARRLTSIRSTLPDFTVKGRHWRSSNSRTTRTATSPPTRRASV